MSEAQAPPGAGVPVGPLIERARNRASLSIAQLAAESGVSRSALHGYVRGASSPDVRTLDRVLAACGLQLRVALEPLLADVDARVDLLEGTPPELSADSWQVLVASLEDHPDARDGFALSGARSGSRAPRRGRVTWAIDGATALVLHGLSAEPHGLQAMDVVVRLDEALRFWMRAVSLRGCTADDRPVQDWLDADAERIVEALGGALGGAAERWCALGFVRVRVLIESEPWPTTVLMSLPWAPVPLPVVTVDEVERGHPVYAEVLARWRSRRTV